MTKVEDLRRKYSKVLSENSCECFRPVKIEFTEETLEKLKADKTVIGHGTVEFPTKEEQKSITSSLNDNKKFEIGRETVIR